METFIPILIAIVVFAFQAYANFQKEQEKAKKRNLGQPPLPEENANRPIIDTQPPITDHRPPITDHRPPITDPRSPTPNHRPLTPDHPSPTPGHQPFGDYSGVMDVEEVRRVRSTRKQQQTIQRLEVDEGVTPITAGEDVEFDLRDAVIKSAILERPYQ